VNTKETIKNFDRLFPGNVPRVFSAPGRVNLIGEHTDYNDGFVFPMALEHHVLIAISSRDDRKVNLRSEDMNETVSFSLDDNKKRRNHWSDYTAGVARMLELEGTRLPGADILVDSTVPVGAGLSSSAAIEISSALAFLSLVNAKMDLPSLAKLGQKAENQFVGMNCGIMDQFISAGAKKDHALFLDCRSLEFKQIPLEADDVKIIICNTMVKHELETSEYNKRRAECEEGVRILQNKYPRIKTLRDVSSVQFEESAPLLPGRICKRVKHVVFENKRVCDSVAALNKNDLKQFGGLMNESHESLKTDYEVSCRELDLMVELARNEPGCLGARMTGGGFGGSTVNLVLNNDVDHFSSAVSRGYEKETGVQPQIYISSPAEGAREII